MNVIVSNHRYKLYNQGFKFIIEFRFKSSADAELFKQLSNYLTELHGPDKSSRLPQGQSWHIWEYNKHWRKEINNAAKRKRIYLENESDMSLIMLKVSQ